MSAGAGETLLGGGLAPAYAAVRTRRGLVALLLGLAVAGWWWTLDQMRGMDNGPWTGFGSLGWFLGVWVVMMAAMMLPSIAPTVALYSRMTRQRFVLLPLLFATGYLLTWAGAGVLAFAARDGINTAWSGVLAWDHAGRWAAGATLILAAIYQMTPLKDVCLGKCRSPLGLLLGSWREGKAGALRMGIKNGAWCVGCCWALMAALVALGVMSVVWMAVVAGLIAFEKTIPSRRLAVSATTTILVGLGLLLLVAPDAIPGFTTPSHSPMRNMPPMGSETPVMSTH
jgi:predicted metal-binding membrane protein